MKIMHPFSDATRLKNFHWVSEDAYASPLSSNFILRHRKATHTAKQINYGQLVEESLTLAFLRVCSIVSTLAFTSMLRAFFDSKRFSIITQKFWPQILSITSWAAPGMSKMEKWFSPDLAPSPYTHSSVSDPCSKYGLWRHSDNSHPRLGLMKTFSPTQRTPYPPFASYLPSLFLPHCDNRLCSLK